MTSPYIEINPPKFKAGDVVLVVADYSDKEGSSFTVTKIKNRRGVNFYFDESENWVNPYLETFDGWWEEKDLERYEQPLQKA